MGCDIHCYAERKGADGRYELLSTPSDLLGDRNYSVFAFLAGVRNYSGIEPLAEQRGVPDDASKSVLDAYERWYGDAHSASWLSVDELTSFDYTAEMEDRRAMRQVGPRLWDGGCTDEPDQGQRMNWREFLRQQFFEDLKALREAGADRIVFWFDN